MLNSRYFILGNEENGVLRNDQSLGSAWLVSGVVAANSADQEIATVCEIDPSTTAVIDQSRFEVSAQQFNNSGKVTLVEYQPNYLRYEFENPANGLVVFSEIYYPRGWSATVDGEPVDILRANYVLRALEVPAGSHIIEFRFQPAAYHAGNKIMMVSSVLVLLLLAGSVFLELRPRSEVSADSKS